MVGVGDANGDGAVAFFGTPRVQDACIAVHAAEGSGQDAT